MKKIVLIFKYSGSEKSSNNLLKNMYLTYVGLFWSCNTRFLKGGGVERCSSRTSQNNSIINQAQHVKY